MPPFVAGVSLFVPRYSIVHATSHIGKHGTAMLPMKSVTHCQRGVLSLGPLVFEMVFFVRGMYCRRAFVLPLKQ